jgi:hypothetical protein
MLNKINEPSNKLTSEQILPTVEIVSTGYKPRKVSAPRRIASLPVYLLTVKQTSSSNGSN